MVFERIEYQFLFYLYHFNHLQLDASDIGVILGLADGSVKPTFNPLADAKSLVGLKNKDSGLYKDLVNEGAKIRLNNVRVESFINTPKEEQLLIHRKMSMGRYSQVFLTTILSFWLC